MRRPILPKTPLGRWSISLATAFTTVISLWVAVFVAQGALAPNLAGAIALCVTMIALPLMGLGAVATAVVGIVRRIDRSTLVFLGLAVSSIGVSALGVVALGSPKHVTRDEIFAHLLTVGHVQGRYIVVEPDLSLEGVSDQEDNVRHSLHENGLYLDSLVTALFANNKEPARMNLPSSPDKGYLIDYDGRFQSYFTKDGGGWVQLRKENPEAGAVVSYPSPPMTQPPVLSSYMRDGPEVNCSVKGTS